MVHREYMVAFGKVVDATLKLRDEVTRNNYLLEKALEKLRKSESKLEAEQAKTKKLVAALEVQKALIKKAPQVGLGLARIVLRLDPPASLVQVATDQSAFQMM